MRFLQARSWRPGSALLLCVGLQACAGLVREIAAEATPVVVAGAIEGGTNALAKDQVRADLATLIGDPSIRAALVDTVTAVLGASVDSLTSPRRAKRFGEAAGLMLGSTLDALATSERLRRISAMTNAFVAGVADTFADPERARQLGGASADMITQIGGATADTLRTQLAPAIAEGTGQILDTALTVALSDKHRDALANLLETSMRAAIKGATDGIREDVGPALSEALNSPDVSMGLETMAYQVTKGIIRGSSDAVKELAAGTTTEEKVGWMGRFATVLATTASVGLVFVFALALSIIVIAVMLVRSSRERKRLEAQSSRREAALFELLAAVSASNPGDGTLRRRLEQLSDEAAVDGAEAPEDGPRAGGRLPNGH